MAGTQRNLDDALTADLEPLGGISRSARDLRELFEKSPKKFSFFRAVHLIERLAADAVPVGTLGPPQKEAIRFLHDPSFVFHSSDITDLKLRVIRDGNVFTEITTSFLGLHGSVSPLANFVTEDILFNDDTAVRAFYDIFHHRVISLFYRAWKKYRVWAGYRTDATDVSTRRALSFVGVDAHGALPKYGLPAASLLGLAPLLAMHTRPSRSLQIMLEGLLETRVRIESFVMRRVVLEPHQRAKMGIDNATVGVDLTIGASVLDRSGRFRVIVGPLSYEMFETLLPRGKNHLTLRRIIDQFTRGVLEVELELRLSDDQTPKFRLGSPTGSNLGTTTTVSTKRSGLRVRILLSASTTNVQPQVVDESLEPLEEEQD